MNQSELEQMKIANDKLSIPIITKLKRADITHMVHLIELDEDKLLLLAQKVHLKRKEIDELKKYVLNYVPERFSDDFRFLPKHIKNSSSVKVQKVTIQEVLTASEASDLWGLERSAVRKAIERDKFYIESGECRKSGGTWLVTAKAMERVFGKKRGINDEG